MSLGTGDLLPIQALPDLSGVERVLSAAGGELPLLVVHGHRTCGTTRLALPYVERIHRRKTRGRVVVVLQDTPEDARTLCRDLDLTLPVLLEADPYPFAAALQADTVPTLMLVDADGRITHLGAGFRRTELEAMGAALGVAGPLFAPDDKAPALRPG